MWMVLRDRDSVCHRAFCFWLAVLPRVISLFCHPLLFFFTLYPLALNLFFSP